jgi:GDP-L-fucose synthase
MSKLRIFLTGSGGFIGRNIIEQLGWKYTILAPLHRELELTDAPAVETYFARHHVDVVVHTANIGGNRAEKDFPSPVAYNLRVFFTIVRNRKYFKKFIYLGSGTQYGKQSPIVRAKETDLGTRIPADEFGLYKYACAQYIEDSTLPFINLILFGIYGKYEPYAFRFISNALCRVLFDIPITISQNVFFDYLWIDDFVRILDHFISHVPKYRTYNVGTGKRIDLLSIAKKVLRITGKKLPIRIAQPGLKDEYTCDISRLKAEIPTLHFADFDESIRSLYDYYQNKKHALDKKSLL